MKLSEILKSAGIDVVVERDAEITGVENNSSRIKPGDIFVAIKGGKLNGADFIADASGRGAPAAVTDLENKGAIDPSKHPEIEVVFAPDIRRIESKLAALLYPRAP